MSLDWLLQDAASPGQWLANFAGGSLDLCSPRAISLPEFPDLKVLSVEANSRENHTLTVDPNLGGYKDPVTGLSFCNITVSYTHPGWHDEVTVTTYVPHKDQWNGRLMATGGGGLVTGGPIISQLTMIPGLAEGFAVSTTDGGHSHAVEDAAPQQCPWALSSPGNVNWPLLVDFASVALHDLSTISKAVVKAFHGEPAAYSYFYGGSTGGRQGHMLAQRYPADFDGIVAIFPAINWTRFLMANIWPVFVMDRLGVYPRACEFNAITEAAIASCDARDGVEDGVVSRLDLCDFSPHDLVGKEFDCDGTSSVFTSEAATIAKATWDGPRSSTGEFQWHGFSLDANLTQLGLGPALTTCDDKGENCDAVPFAISTAWLKYWLRNDPKFDTRNLSHEEWDDLFHTSVNQYNSIIGTDDPNLSSLRKSGTKMINWHGISDEAIPFNGSVEYYDRVLARDPDAQAYYRFYAAPGTDHCVDCGLTPPIMKTIEIMKDWVEKGVAPDTLPVAGKSKDGADLERDICMYPRVQHYIGGDMTKPSSFKCV